MSRRRRRGRERVAELMFSVLFLGICRLVIAMKEKMPTQPLVLVSDVVPVTNQ